MKIDETQFQKYDKQLKSTGIIISSNINDKFWSIICYVRTPHLTPTRKH